MGGLRSEVEAGLWGRICRDYFLSMGRMCVTELQIKLL